MAKFIELLREEHRDIEKLLVVLEGELGVFDRQEAPDYEIIQAVISYFQDYPDCCHHPKEDMVFEKLRARDPIAAESVGDIEAEHRHEAERLQRVAHLVRSVPLDHDIPRKPFDDDMRGFIEQERAHMKMEEQILFPAAAKALRPEDWSEIDLKWSDTNESLFNVALEEKCHSLRDRILRWARENKAHQINKVRRKRLVRSQSVR